MVLSALLRDFAVDPFQTRRNRRDVRLGVYYRVSAVARHLQGQVGGLPASFQGFLLDLCRLHGSPRLYGITATGRRLCDRRPVPNRLLFSLLPGDPAVAWTIREAEAPASLHLRRGVGQAWPSRGGGRQFKGSARTGPMTAWPQGKKRWGAGSAAVLDW